MGQPKADLAWDGRTFLAHILETLEPIVDQRVVVAAVEQSLDGLPPSVRVLRDVNSHEGPLVALGLALTELMGRADAVFLTGCDNPLLPAVVVRELFEQLKSFDAVMLTGEDGLPRPLTAVYRPAACVLPVQELVADGERRLRAVVSHLRTRLVPFEDLQRIDPQLHALANINTPEDYEAALATWRTMSRAD
jgi:molybdopterin-guanine dinucleotide biosynthesis protein A